MTPTQELFTFVSHIFAFMQQTKILLRNLL